MFKQAHKEGDQYHKEAGFPLDAATAACPNPTYMH